MLKRILIVEDDSEIREYLRKTLIDQDYATVTATGGVEALELIDKKKPDLVVLDLGLPDLSGETVCVKIKKDYPEIPVIILTAKAQSSDVIHSFKLGADDYVSKPFVAEELIARIKARLKSINGEEAKLEVDNLVLDPETFSVTRDGKQITLTQKEFELLRYLMLNKGKVMTREMILNKVWLYSPDIESRVVDVYMGYLRKKIDKDKKKKLIKSIRGFGYSIQA